MRGLEAEVGLLLAHTPFPLVAAEAQRAPLSLRVSPNRVNV